MKHCILAKYRAEVYPRREALLPRIREIFAPLTDLPGIHGVRVYPNCVARDNRYDVLIVLDMERDALPLYDGSAPHHLWKEEFGPLLAQKGLGEVERLYHERIGVYRALADATLDNSQGYYNGMYNLERLVRSLFPW